MKVLLARLLLAFMLVWLPLQGYAVEAMSTCQRHHDHMAMMEEESTQHEGCHGDSSPSAQSSSFIKSNLNCDDCASCHLISQPALTVKPLFLGIDAVKPRQPVFSVSFSLFFPEQPQRPPLAFFS